MRRLPRGLGAVLVLAMWVAPVRGDPLFAAPSAAQIKLVPAIGPPTSPVTVKGRGFGASEIVDLTFDAVPVGTATTTMGGKFKAAVEVPDTALPGDHTVEAIGEDSGSTAQATFLVRTDWPKFHFDLANSGLNPYENVLSPQTVSGLAQAWAAPAPGYVNTGPVVADEIVYVGVSGIGGQAWLMAVDAATGERVWLRQNFGGTGLGSPAVADGVVYFGTNSDHALHAYDAATGADVWTFTAGGGMSAPAVADGIVYSNSSEGYLYAIDTETGAQVWKSSTGGPSAFSAPAVAGSVVVVGNDELAGKIVAFDNRSGARLWSFMTGGEVQSTPALVDGVVYVGSFDRSMYALNASTGKPLWKTPTGGAVQSSPAVANGTVYVGSNNFAMYAFDINTGSIEWTFPTGAEIGLGAPGVANGVVYVGSEDSTVYAVDAVNGSLLWSYATGGAARSPIVADGSVYIGSFDQNLYSFRLP